MNEYQEHVHAIARQVWDSAEDADASWAALEQGGSAAKPQLR